MRSLADAVLHYHVVVQHIVADSYQVVFHGAFDGVTERWV